ncbi:MAG: hypothetical protein CL928_06415 [Deltaproteobacteria bacterium]|nr:hypothetical protein [Deltaproteobacteria bacterium]
MKLARLVTLTVALSWAFVLLPACDRPTRGDGQGSDDSGDDAQGGDAIADGLVDMLWVVDNSNSMASVQAQVQASMPSLVSALAARDVDFQLGVTTTDIENAGNGNQGNLRSSASIGALGCGAPSLLTSSTGDLVDEFRDLVEVGVSGSGNESGLLAAAYALCKSMDGDFWASLDDRADEDPIKEICGTVPVEERSCNEGFVREGATVVVVVVSDEGDDAYRSSSLPPQQFVADCVLEHNDDPFFGECDCRLGWMLDFFGGMEQPVVFSTIGPTYQNLDMQLVWCDDKTVSLPGPCNPFGSDVCGLDFYQQAACQTGGLFSPVQVTATDNDPSTCTMADFDAITADLIALLMGES